MSSRYALQFQVGILGILLTFAFVWSAQKAKKSIGVKILVLAITAVILAGNLLTTKAELSKAPYRKIHSLEVKEILLDFENQDEETLKQKLEYSKPGKKEALRILKENGLNIFRNEN